MNRISLLSHGQWKVRDYGWDNRRGDCSVSRSWWTVWRPKNASHQSLEPEEAPTQWERDVRVTRWRQHVSVPARLVWTQLGTQLRRHLLPAFVLHPTRQRSAERETKRVSKQHRRCGERGRGEKQVREWQTCGVHPRTKEHWSKARSHHKLLHITIIKATYQIVSPTHYLPLKRSVLVGMGGLSTGTMKALMTSRITLFHLDLLNKLCCNTFIYQMFFMHYMFVWLLTSKVQYVTSLFIDDNLSVSTMFWTELSVDLRPIE